MISDTEARRISSEWNGGGATALYALSSTGAILDPAFSRIGAINEIHDCYWSDEQGWISEADAAQLETLESYVKTNGPRGPVDGWSTLS